MFARRPLALLMGAIGLMSVGCQRGANPERACASFLRALSEGDAGAVFDNLVETTQWSLYTVAKSHRRMRDLMVESYPADEREAGLSRLYGAEADSGRDLFLRLYPDRYAARFSAMLGSGQPRLRLESGQAAGATPAYLCQRETGQPFRLVRAASGQFGIGDLDSEWEQAQLRAIHDLDTVDKNAALYRRVKAAQKDGSKGPSETSSP